MASFLPLQLPVPYTNVGRLASAPVQIKKQNSKLFFSQESIDDESKLVVTMNINGLMCPRQITFNTSPDKDNYQKIKDILSKIGAILLADKAFENLQLEVTDSDVFLTMKNGKVINIKDNLDDSTLGRYIIDEILKDSNISYDEICPILHENVKQLLDDGEELVRIEGEPHIYHKDTLEEAIAHSGLNISPMTRQPITMIMPVKKFSQEHLPISALNSIHPTIMEEEIDECKVEKMDGDPINVTIVVDVSWSMGYSGDNMAYKPLKRYILSLPKLSNIEIITFSDDYQVSFELADVKELDLNSQLKKMLKPRGGTAFRDAMIKVITDFKKSEDRKHLLFVITDGEDVSSKSSIEDLNSITTNAWSEEGKNIDCLFMHPPQLNGSVCLQLPKDKCLTFQTDEKYTDVAIGALENLTRDYSQGRPMKVTKMMRQSSCPANYVNHEKDL